MDRELICGGKFIFSHETISLLVSFNDLPNKINFEGNDLFLNDFLHVSLVCIGKIIEKHAINIPDFKDKIIKDFCEFSSNNEIGPVSYTNEFKFVEKEDKKTIVVMCNVSNLYRFFDLMNEKYGLNIEYPPTHVTLYKLANKLGIFLTDLDDIKNLTKPILNPIGFLL